MVLGDGLKASYEEKNSEIWVLANVDLSDLLIWRRLYENRFRGNGKSMILELLNLRYLLDI